MSEVSNVSHAPLVSVVIPAYNAEKTLEQAMASVLQERQVPLELIVVDDGSTDSTPAAIDAAAVVDSRVRRVSRPNGHVAAACNTGTQSSRGKYIAFLEADDEWLPGKLTEQIELLDSWPDVAAVFCNFVNHDEILGTRELLSEQQRETFAALNLQEIGYERAIIKGDIRPHLITSNFMLRSSIMIRRDALLSVGGSDESLRGDDEWDLWFRMAESMRFAYIAKPFGIRHKRSDSMSRPSPNWFKALIKSRSKCLSVVQQTVQLQSQVPRLRAQLLRLHRSLITAHNKQWECGEAWRAWFQGLKYGLDPLSFLLAILSCFGPIPFEIRRVFVRRGMPVELARSKALSRGNAQSHLITP